MQKNYVYKSVALHIAVVLLCVFDIPFLGSKRNFDEQPPIMVDLENVNEGSADEGHLKSLIGEFALSTGSRRARRLLDNWENELPKFVKVFPVEYRKAVEKGWR